MKPISRFEKLAQRMVEGSFSRLFGGRLEPLEVATQIAHALEDSQRDGRIGVVYRVHLHPDDYESILADQPEAAQVLGDAVSQLARQAGLTLTAPLDIRLTPDAGLGRQQVLVHHLPEDDQAGSTQIFNREAVESGPLTVMRAVDAFLIVNGRRHFPLAEPVVSIGRRTDNDIVIELPTVSRQHAQIRWRYGHFVIYDLGSRGGTFVNGQRVRESVLHPGDVITLSDVPLIYGEGLDGREAGERTGADNPTHTMPINYADFLDGG